MNGAATTASLVRGLLLAAACHAAAQAAPPAYTIISLGTNTSGLAISPNGTYVTGYDFIHGDGFVWTQAGGKQDLSRLITVPPRPFAVANGVNDSGNSAGSIQQQSWGQQPLTVAWTGTTGATLPLPDGVTIAKGNALNSAGTVVGAINVGVDWYATVFSGTGATVLPQLTTSGGILQYAYGIADTGRIVGQATSTNGAVIYAFYLDPGAPTAAEIPGAGIAFGISQDGAYITGPSGTNSYVFAPATGTSTIVPMVPGAASLETRAVNNLGYAVGYAVAVGSIPFLFDGSSTYTLQSLLSGTDATQWDMTSGNDNAAYGISNNGIITGRAEHNGVLSGFVMIPVPEPAAASLLAIGAALVGWSLRRRRVATTRALLGGLVIAAACQACAQAAPPAYTIQSLGVDTSGLAVSPNGTYVTGYNVITGNGFIWTQAGGKQSFSPLTTTPSRPFAMAYGVNDSGNAGGSIQQQSYGLQPLPVAWTGTAGAILPLPGGVTVGGGYGLNSAGTMVGTINVGIDWYATVFSGTGATVLPQLTTSGGILQYAYGIADTGRIVGQATSTNGSVTYAFYLDPGAPTAAEIPGAGIAFGISQNGAYITGPSGTNSYVFAPATGTSTIVPMVPGATSLETRAVNDLGHAVGAAGAVGSIPILFDGTSTYTLQSLLSGSDATQWNMVTGVDNDALGISNNGIITGLAEHNGVLSGFVMIPVPEPAAASLLAIGSGLAMLALRGRRVSR